MRASITHDVAWSAESVSQVTTDRSLDCNAKGLVAGYDLVVDCFDFELVDSGGTMSRPGSEAGRVKRGMKTAWVGLRAFGLSEHMWYVL